MSRRPPQIAKEEKKVLESPPPVNLQSTANWSLRKADTLRFIIRNFDCKAPEIMLSLYD